MNFIAIDLKVIEVSAPGVARALGIDVASVIGSLSLLWHRCWSMKSDRLSKLELRGYFPQADAGDLLAAFGLLEEDGETYRVRGAERYLRITEQRQKAGKARSSSAGRSAGRFTSGAPAADQRSTSGGPALSPSTEHRAPKKETSAPAAPTPRETDALQADFREVIGATYAWQGAKDGVAFAELRKVASLEEIRTRWKRGLSAPADDWASCRTVAQLRSKWNDLATAKPAQRVSIEHQPSRIL